MNEKQVSAMAEQIKDHLTGLNVTIVVPPKSTWKLLATVVGANIVTVFALGFIKKPLVKAAMKAKK